MKDIFSWNLGPKHGNTLYTGAHDTWQNMVSKKSVADNWEISKYLKLNITFWKYHGSKRKSKRKLENNLNWMKMKIQHQNLWDTPKALLQGEIYSVKILY